MLEVRTAVVGHVEWVEFARVPRWPEAGEIIHASDVWSEPAGGGAVVARQLALLAGRCELFTAFGEDEAGRAAVRRRSSSCPLTKSSNTRRAATGANLSPLIAQSTRWSGCTEC